MGEWGESGVRDHESEKRSHEEMACGYEDRKRVRRDGARGHENGKRGHEDVACEHEIKIRYHERRLFQSFDQKRRYSVFVW